MDIKEIQLEVFKQSGINIDPDDPFFVALTMLYKMGNIIESKNEALISQLHKAAETYHKSRSYWHNQNERLIVEQVNQVKLAVLEISNIKNYVGEVATGQSKVQLQPILAEIATVLEHLKKKDSVAIEQLRKTSDTQDRWSRAAHYIVTGFILISLMAGLGGFYVGNILASQEIAKNAEWLGSEDGKYALQLRDSGSLKQLATCHTDQEPSGWKVKDGKSCIPSPVQTKDGYLTTGWKINQ